MDLKITHFYAWLLRFFPGVKDEIGAARRPPHTQHDETRGLTRPDLTETWGFSGRNPHQQREHFKSCKMVSLSPL